MADQPNPPEILLDGRDEDDNRPLVFVHRISAFNLAFIGHLRNEFRLIDTLDSPEPTHSFLSRHAQSIRVLLCLGPSKLAADTLNLLPSLELVVVSSAGLDHVDLVECRRRGIAVTNASAAFSEDVADYAVGLLIDVLRKISAGNRFVRSGSWPVKGESPLGFKLGGKRIGIVGMGGIGSKVAERLVAFGSSIAYTSRKKKSVPFPFYENVCDLAVNSDVLVVCCALTDETQHIINKNVMKALGENGVIINVGRGALVDEKELVQFLVQGEIGGAGLDVYEDEPNVPKELFLLENVVLSPHTAVMTPGSIDAVKELIRANLKAFFSNQPLLSLVQHERIDSPCF